MEKEIRCLPKDCKISIKLSAEAFVKSAKLRRQQDYHFDKSGLCVDYLSFLSLINDCLKPNTEFWKSIKDSYNVSSRIKLPAGPTIGLKRSGKKEKSKSSPSKSRKIVSDDEDVDNADDGVGGDGEDHSIAEVEEEEDSANINENNPEVETTDGPSTSSGKPTRTSGVSGKRK